MRRRQRGRAPFNRPLVVLLSWYPQQLQPRATPSNVGITINLEPLEEEPPAVGESWRQTVKWLPSQHEQRTTFGLLVWVSSFAFLFLR
jgi:hypothetical protein